MKMRPYQEECVVATMDAFKDHPTVLCCLPTGCGKTVIFAEIIRRHGDGHRTMVIAHRDELIRQAFQKITAITGQEPDVEMASEWADSANLRQINTPVVVSSVQTQNAGKNPRMERFDPFEFGHLIIDEAHHAPAKSYRAVIDYYRQNPNLRVSGWTATPDRADELALGKVFGAVAYDYEIVDAIDDGWLVEIDQQYVTVHGLDFSKARTVAGDFNQKDLAALMLYEKVLHEVAGATLELAGDRKTLAFTSSVAHAERLAEIFNRHKPGSAFIIHGGTNRDERRSLLRGYKAGDYQFMCNVGIATEGFDEPGIEVIAMARPTKSRCLYAQMIGRGTRPAESVVPYINDTEGSAARKSIVTMSEKPRMLVIDFCGNSGRHKLVSSCEILGGRFDDAVVASARAKAESDGGRVDMTDALREAAKEAQEAAERSRSAVVAKARWSSRKVSPFDLFNIKPSRERGWHKGRSPSANMVAALKKAGIENVDLMSFGDAGRVMKELVRRWNADLCNFKQARVLKRYGESPDCSYAEASAKIDAIKSNGWKPLDTARRSDTVAIGG